MIRQSLADQFGDGRQQIRLTDRLVDLTSAGHLGGPTYKKRHAMAAFVDRTFSFSIDPVAVVAEQLDAFLPSRFGSVVTGEDNQGVIGQLLTIERRQNPADVPIGFDHEISVSTGVALAAELLDRNDRFVRRRVGQVQKERLAIARAIGLALDPLDRFVGEPGQTLRIDEVCGNFQLTFDNTPFIRGPRLRQLCSYGGMIR